MGMKQFFAKGWPTRLGYWIATVVPHALGLMLVGTAARAIAVLKPDVYWAIRGNMRQVLGPEATEAELHHITYRIAFNAIRGYFELFRNAGLGRLDLSEFDPPVRVSPAVEAYFRYAVGSGRGLIVLGCHMSNFDLAGIRLSQMMPMPVQALSLADPPPGVEFFNRLRELGNGIVTPMSPEALRQAIDRLRGGGIVLTGVDRPIGQGDEPASFFGHTANLPAGYIRIPLIADCLVMTLSVVYEEGAYWIVCNPPFEMERTGDRRRDAELNRQRVLFEIEDHIRRAPDQWMMFVPVWQES